MIFDSIILKPAEIEENTMPLLLFCLVIIAIRSQLIYNASLILNYSLTPNPSETILQIENGTSTTIYAVVKTSSSSIRVDAYDWTTLALLSSSPVLKATMYPSINGMNPKLYFAKSKVLLYYQTIKKGALVTLKLLMNPKNLQSYATVQ